jgi:hypothetical protein
MVTNERQRNNCPGNFESGYAALGVVRRERSPGGTKCFAGLQAF